MYKGEGGIRRWRLFREMNNEKDKKPDQDTHDSSTTRVGRRVLSSGNKWAETQSEFTNSETIRSCSGKSESSSENDVADGKSDLPENTDSNKLCETVGEDSISGAMATTCYGANTKVEFFYFNKFLVEMIFTDIFVPLKCDINLFHR